jgi:hypothetical protein
MKYELNYTKIEGEGQKRAKAVRDIMEYIGEEKFTELHNMLVEAVAGGEVKDVKHFHLLLFLFPVSGYPLTAWYEVIRAEINAARDIVQAS